MIRRRGNITHALGQGQGWATIANEFSGSQQKERNFFFEKKKQKTFD